MIAAIKRAGSNTRGLLAYLYGPGDHDEHLDPHIVAGFAMLGMPDPGRDENATLTELARYLDEPVRLRNGAFGKKITDHVWHCPVRAAPEDRYLSDTEWGEIAQRIAQAAGIAPAGDDLACRWIAVRHADDHIHILATTVREDGRRPKLHDSGIRVGDACREIEKDYGLRQLKKGDRTGARRPTQAEMHKAERLGWDQPSPEWLQDRIRAAIPHVTGAVLIVTSLFLRAAGQEWSEQGDVWARVESKRPLPEDVPVERVTAMAGTLRKLLAIDATSALTDAGPLTSLAEWIDGMKRGGQALGDAGREGRLGLGTRGILARHILFHWNRMGFTTRQQAIWARAARETVLGN